MKLTETAAIMALMDADMIRRGLAMPRYTPDDWWECDLFELTASGYFVEYEVKLTLADFKNDAKKEKDVRGSGRWEDATNPKYPGQQNWVTEKQRKHDLLASGSPQGPSRFWYVAPQGLIPKEILPAWAGLIELDWFGETSASESWRQRHVVEAPRLHKNKAHQQVARDLFKTCYYRFHDVLRAERRNDLVLRSESPPEIDLVV